MERFSCMTKLFSGEGAIASLGSLNIRRLLLVAEATDSRVGQVVSAAHAGEAEIFSKVTPAPTVEQAVEGIALTRQFRPDTIAALGDSALHCAKAIVRFSGVPTRLVAISTAPCFGPEVTDAATLTSDRERRTFTDTRMRPDIAIRDSALISGPTADTGFQILSHALESYVSTDAGAITDALVRDAFAMVFAALPASITGKPAPCQRIHTAAAMVGIACSQTGLGLCHAMTQTLGSGFSVPYGILSTILLPSVIDCNAHRATGKYAQIARGAGLGGSTDTAAVRNLKNALIRLRRELSMPATLTQAGIDPREIRHRAGDFVKEILADPCCRSNPMPVEDFMVRRILEDAMGRADIPAFNRLIR